VAAGSVTECSSASGRSGQVGRGWVRTRRGREAFVGGIDWSLGQGEGEHEAGTGTRASVIVMAPIA